MPAIHGANGIHNILLLRHSAGDAVTPSPPPKAVGGKVPERCRRGDLWQLGKHHLYIGDALEEESYSILLGEDKADMVFTDPPYNVKIEGNVADSNATTRANFKEFAFASGEMNPQEFVNFLSKSLGNMAEYSKDGSIHYVCMDWRHTKSPKPTPKAGRSGMGELQSAAEGIYTELKNVCVYDPAHPWASLHFAIHGSRIGLRGNG